MEMSANNCCKSIAVFTMFPGFCLNKLQQLFSDSSYAYQGSQWGDYVSCRTLTEGSWCQWLHILI